MGDRDFPSTLVARMRRMPIDTPVFLVLSLCTAVVVLRLTDLLVFRLNDWPDPMLTSRLAGVALVIGLLYLLRRPMRTIGLHTQHLVVSIVVGGLLLFVAAVHVYGFTLSDPNISGEAPRLVIGVIDGQAGLITGAAFICVCLLGQVLNAFVEESIFRGIMLPLLMQRMTLWRANGIQALLFASAHLVWPLSSWTLGTATPEQAIGQSIMLLLSTGVGGLVFGYLYYRTNNLWAPMIAHFVDNVIGMFIHVATIDRINAEVDLFIVSRVAFLSLVIVAWAVTSRMRIEHLQPWLVAQNRQSATGT